MKTKINKLDGNDISRALNLNKLSFDSDLMELYKNEDLDLSRMNSLKIDINKQSSERLNMFFVNNVESVVDYKVLHHLVEKGVEIKSFSIIKYYSQIEKMIEDYIYSIQKSSSCISDKSRFIIKKYESLYLDIAMIDFIKPLRDDSSSLSPVSEDRVSEIVELIEENYDLELERKSYWAPEYGDMIFWFKFINASLRLAMHGTYEHLFGLINDSIEGHKEEYKHITEMIILEEVESEDDLVEFLLKNKSETRCLNFIATKQYKSIKSSGELLRATLNKSQKFVRDELKVDKALYTDIDSKLREQIGDYRVVTFYLEKSDSISKHLGIETMNQSPNKFVKTMDDVSDVNLNEAKFKVLSVDTNKNRVVAAVSVDALK